MPPTLAWIARHFSNSSRKNWNKQIWTKANEMKIDLSDEEKEAQIQKETEEKNLREKSMLKKLKNKSV